MRTAYMTQNPYYNPNRSIKVKGLMLHSVGVGQPDPDVFIRQMDKPGYTAASVHGFIGAEETVLTLPCMETPGVAMFAAHGGGSVNSTHIGIEMCEPKNVKYIGYSDKFSCEDVPTAIAFVERVIANAVELFAALCKFHGLDPLKDIISHSEGHKRGIASGHSDPEHLWRGLGMDYDMDLFRQAVQNKMNGIEEETSMVRYQRLSNIPDNWDSAGDPRATIEKLMDAQIINGDGSDPYGHGDVIDLSHDMVRTLIMEYRGGAFDKRLIAAGLEPAVG